LSNKFVNVKDAVKSLLILVTEEPGLLLIPCVHIQVQ